jgi:hypothetical protein
MAKFSMKKGYKCFANSGIPVHRRVAARKLGRPLMPGEVVHHINRNKNDNRKSNLWVFSSQVQHYITHIKDKKSTGRW